MLKKSGFLTISIFLQILSALSQQQTDSHVVYAKKWSKVDGKPIYSDWERFEAITIDKLSGYEPVKTPEFNKYGSTTQIKSQAKGFFYTKKINGRWWIVDPDGYANLSIAVNGVRQGSSERNKTELIKKYGNAEKWIAESHQELIDLGFNGTGCWSEISSVQNSNKKSNNPLIYNMIWNFSGSFHLQKSDKSKDIYFPVFSPEFEKFANDKARELAKTKNDPNLLGHFSDNELEFKKTTLDEYLAIENKKDFNHQAATKFLKKYRIKPEQVTDSIREIFVGIAAEKYYQVVSSAIKKYDPNHLYLGSRLHGRPKNIRGIVQAAGKYADIISINYYGYWEPMDKHFSGWINMVDKPIIITEFYTKGMDSGMENKSGAGWIVKTQEERGIHYENFCLKLLQQKNCVGWHWFRYMDNDPTDLSADPSNNNSNKGIVDNTYAPYTQLTAHMKILNYNRYKLIQYFDR